MKKTIEDPNELDIGASGTTEYEVMVKMVLGDPKDNSKWLFGRDYFKSATKKIIEIYIKSITNLPEIDEKTRDRILAELEGLEDEIKELNDVYRYKYISVRLFTIINLILGYKYTGGRKLHTPYFIQTMNDEICEKEIKGKDSGDERSFDKSSEVQRYRKVFISQLKKEGLTNAKIGIILGMSPQQVSRIQNMKS